MEARTSPGSVVAGIEGCELSTAMCCCSDGSCALVWVVAKGEGRDTGCGSMNGVVGYWRGGSNGCVV